MIRRHFLLLVLGLFSVALLCLSPGCGYPKHIDPLILTFPTKELAALSAQARAKDIGGIVLTIDASKHSMEPLLLNDDLIVVDPRVTFDQIKLGTVIIATLLPGRPPVCHRATVRDSLGVMTSGDHNPESDTGARATASNYVGTADTVYRVKP